MEVGPSLGWTRRLRPRLKHRLHQRVTGTVPWWVNEEDDDGGDDEHRSNDGEIMRVVVSTLAGR